MAGIYPPFTRETAIRKVKAGQDLWNTQDPHKVAQAYTPECRWRNRDQFVAGREKIIDFLSKKWKREKGYKLRKELFAFTDNCIAVTFWYEWYEDKPDGTKQWHRTYGLEDWTFHKDGLMAKRQMSGNDVKIEEAQRWFKDDGVDINAVVPPEHEFI
ncbi:uncharacterized protein PHACADRAFT_259565 [Phanerochaete carnosa HHB-10118-sp]|uniref:DUF1348-domain-containing protein n=1 Tax=Phanerochaete carnosa (strain HHB-10118-sp) TaxID=650164 RepID=K5W331_PHACS|nr:uncharacterized protein PHACADRAFT_259565 [Phanerochaete carnosa HHB-10118-sp]EKM53299.1 hypothetical protein PHACADRAFT_259565 [Phanerochaete carnosa HHB-10118-sp]